MHDRSRTVRPALAVAAALLLSLAAVVGVRAADEGSAAPASAVDVTFRVNDAFVKDRMLAGVAIALAREPGGAAVASGKTGDDGTVRIALAPGTWYATYELAGYVPIRDSQTRVEAVLEGTPPVVTTTLTMLLESEGRPPGERRVRVVLNWGSDEGHHVRDADSHLLCACRRDQPHVYFGHKDHVGDAHEVHLDVDDMDWGGPETVTLTNPPPGDYPYWVRDYSNGPGTPGSSQVVVRVFVGDAAAGEFHAPAKAQGRLWRPFAALRVRDDLGVEIVPFTPAELASGADDRLPQDVADTTHEAADGGSRVRVGRWIFGGFAAFLALRAIVRRVRRRRIRN